MSRHKPKIIVIVGPTASGKTDLGIFLAKKFNGEVVNADSRQIYRGMDVATAKPTFDKKYQVQKTSDRLKSGLFVRGIKHHLFDIAKPDQIVTLAQWKKKAIKAIQDIHRRKKLPIIVGGTGLYIKTLVENWEIPEVPPNPKLRAQLERELAKKGIGALWKRLIKLDPDARTVVQKDNPRRVIRALEVCLLTGKPFTSQRTKGLPLFEVLEIGLNPSREELYRRIDKRVDWQIKNGLIKETKRLLKKYATTLPAMSGIGYGEISEHLSLRAKRSNLMRSPRRSDKSELLAMTLEEAAQKIKFHTHDYARRQLTWFRRDPKIHWVKTKKQAERLVRKLNGRLTLLEKDDNLTPS